MLVEFHYGHLVMAMTLPFVPSVNESVKLDDGQKIISADVHHVLHVLAQDDGKTLYKAEVYLISSEGKP